MPQKVLPVSEVEVDSVHRSSANQSKLQATLNSQIERIKSTVPARFVEKADQVLLGLSHTGQSIPMLLKQTFNKIDRNPNDVIGRISRTVLEQAQSVRQTLVTKSAQLSEIADGVSSRVKSVNPFSPGETEVVQKSVAAPKKKVALSSVPKKAKVAKKVRSTVKPLNAKPENTKPAKLRAKRVKAAKE